MFQLPSHELIEPWVLNLAEWEVVVSLAVMTPTNFAAYSMGMRPPSPKSGVYELDQSVAESFGYIVNSRKAVIHVVDRPYQNRLRVLENNARAGKFCAGVITEGAEFPVQKLVQFAHAAGWELPHQLINLLPNIQKATKPTRRNRQHEFILETITTLNFSPLEIPAGGKAKIKEACITQPDLFTKDGFDHAWKAGLTYGLFRLANHEKYSRRESVS